MFVVVADARITERSPLSIGRRKNISEFLGQKNKNFQLFSRGTTFCPQFAYRWPLDPHGTDWHKGTLPNKDSNMNTIPEKQKKQKQNGLRIDFYIMRTAQEQGNFNSCRGTYRKTQDHVWQAEMEDRRNNIIQHRNAPPAKRLLLGTIEDSFV